MARSSGRRPDLASLMGATSRAVVHLRAQEQRKRLGLIFGSGASKDLGFPDWPELIRRITRNQKVDAKALVSRLRKEDKGSQRSLAALTHILFEHFRSRMLAEMGLSGSVPVLVENQIKSEWLLIIHAGVYRDIKSATRRETIEGHPYLTAFKDIIKNSPMTVNYNFDDTLEKLLLFNRTDEERTTTRGYETTDEPSAQFQHDSGVIYHPNGFLPSQFSDGPSVEVVFANDAFQDQLISAAHGRYVHLSNHLFRNTCLLIGLSLGDTTLQSMLRQNAVRNPGHIHYIVHFVPPGVQLERETKVAIFSANFSSYNLYTLFLDAAGIRELAELIRMPPPEFERQFPQACKHVYYLLGSVGAGKSTAASNFRNLITYDEWIDERLPELATPQKEVNSPEASRVDNWIAEQFSKKNYALQACKEGIHIVDRCPLDPLTFPGDKQEKAQNLLDEITNDGAFKIMPGQVIMLECDIEELKRRNSLKHKYWTDEDLQVLMDEIESVYHSVPQTRICTRGRAVAEVAREIAKVIFLDEYTPVDIEAKLREFAGGK
jgi:hypothetical protein